MIDSDDDDNDDQCQRKQGRKEGLLYFVTYHKSPVTLFYLPTYLATYQLDANASFFQSLSVGPLLIALSGIDMACR